MAENFNGDFSNLNNEQNTNTQNNPFGNSNVNTAQPQGLLVITQPIPPTPKMFRRIKVSLQIRQGKAL